MVEAAAGVEAAVGSAPPLRVVLLGYRSNPLSGGQGVYLKYISRSLMQRGHSVIVVSGQPYPSLDDGVKLVKLPGLDMTNNKRKLLSFKLKYLSDSLALKEWWMGLTGAFYDPEAFGFRALEWLRAHRDEFDVIHDNQTLCTALRDIQDEFPLVSTLHHPLTQDLKFKLSHIKGIKAKYGAKRWYGSYIKNQKKITPYLNCVVCVSEAGMREAERDLNLNPNACAIHPCGVDTDRFRPIPQIPKDKNRMIAVLSADEPIKGGIYLVEALQKLRKQIPDLRLTLVSRLNEDGQVMKAIQTGGLEPHIDFYNNVSQEKLVELYSQASVSVIPSMYEGFGFPAIEAMACGLPVVATRGGALPEVVQDAALLVPCADSSALAGSVLRVMQDDDLRLRLIVDGRRLINSRYQWPIIIEGIENLYRLTIEAHNKKKAKTQTQIHTETKPQTQTQNQNPN